MPEGAFARIGLAGDDPVGTIGQLECTLGRFGFQWLCACAVYPGLRFPLSVHLGRCLAAAFHRAPPNEDEHLALFRLPWFRSGWMPEDMRLALIQSLEPGLRPVVRAAIEALLFNALDDDKRDPDAAPRLDFALPPRGWQSVLRAWMEGAPAGAPARDAIFVRYMMGRVPRPADLRLNRRLARLFGARLAGWLDRRTLTWGTLALAAAAAVWLFADDAIKPLFTEEQVQVVLAHVRGSNVELRDESTGATIAVLRGQKGEVTSVAFSPDGRTLATGSLDGTLHLWEVATGKEIAVLRGHEGEVTSVAFSPDGTQVKATTSRVVCSWDAKSGALISCSAPAIRTPPKADVPPVEAVSILGKKVRGLDGEDMGMVVDALVNGDGRPRAAVIDFGGFLGVGSRKIAIDWQLLQFRPADPASPILLNLGRAEMQAAPEYRHSQPSQGLVSILGKKVRGLDGEDMGMVVDALVNGDGRPRAAVIDFGPFLGVGSRKIAIDWQLLQFRPADPASPILLNLGRAEMQAAPEYRPSQGPVGH